MKGPTQADPGTALRAGVVTDGDTDGSAVSHRREGGKGVMAEPLQRADHSPDPMPAEVHPETPVAYEGTWITAWGLRDARPEGRGTGCWRPHTWKPGEQTSRWLVQTPCTI